MSNRYFVDEDSIVREIWGKSDTILFIFAGASAEFALNKAVDWLYFTRKLPVDPIGRLFSTVSYARKIVFAEREMAIKAIDSMAAIHAKVETKRGDKIPDWAYRDVLFMLIDYSIRSFELLERKLQLKEKEEVFRVFYRVGKGMGVYGLPISFEEWLTMRTDHLNQNLVYSNFSEDLFKQYRKHLSNIRYRILLETQKMLVPGKVFDLLKFKRKSLLFPFLFLYKICRALKIDSLLKALLLPANYKRQIENLDVVSSQRNHRIIYSTQ